MNGLDKEVNVDLLLSYLERKIIIRALKKKQFNKHAVASHLKKSNSKSLLK